MKVSTSALAEVFAAHRDEPLRELLRRLNAVLEDVEPDRMTVGFLRARREELFTDDAVYDQDASVGGHLSLGKKFIPRWRLRKVVEEGNQFLDGPHQ